MSNRDFQTILPNARLANAIALVSAIGPLTLWAIPFFHNPPWSDAMMIVVGFIVTIFVHESLHYLGFWFFREAHDAKITFRLRGIEPSCTCGVWMHRPKLQVVAMLPALVPIIAAIICWLYRASDNIYYSCVGSMPLGASGLGADLAAYVAMNRIPPHAFVMENSRGSLSVRYLPPERSILQ